MNEAELKRDGTPTPIHLEAGTFHPDRNRVEGPRGTIHLSPMESRLLAFLAERPGKAFTHAELLRRVWGYRESVNSRTVYTTVGRLRSRIEQDPARPRHLLSVKSVDGAGYCFEPLQSAVAPTPQQDRHPDNDDLRTAFVGRQAELDQLHRLVSQGGTLITLVGAGGIGKSRLSRRFSELNRQEFAGDGCFVALSDCTTVDQMTRTVALALGVDQVARDAVDQVSTLLARRGRTLLILDNLEQLGAEAAAPILAWNARAPEATLLCTSRRKLGAAGEEVLSVGPMQDEDAVELFLKRARARGRHLLAEPGAEADVLALVRALDGYPLALELAAARVPILSVTGILARLEQRLRLLSDHQAQPSRHASLRAVIDWSWSLLQPWEQSTLAQLSCFVGGFSMVAAEAVVALDSWPEAPWILDVVQSLEEHSLIRVHHHPSTGNEPRFSLYQSVRAFAEERLAGITTGTDLTPSVSFGPEAEQATFARHGRYHASLDTPSFRRAWGGYTDTDLIRRMAVDLDNFRVAVERAVRRGDGPVAAHCARLATSVYRREGPLWQAAPLVRPLLDVTTGDSNVDVRMTLAESLADAGDLEPAVNESRQAVAEARARGLIEPELSAALCLANARLHREGPSCGEDEARRLLSRCEEVGDLEHRCDALIVHASSVQLQGRKDEALRIYDEAISAGRLVGNLRSVAMASGNMGNIHRDAGRLEAAERAYREAERLHALGHNRRRLAVVRGNLAGLHELRGDLDRTLELYAEALETHQAIGNVRSEMISCGCLAQLFLALGRVSEARQALDRALALVRQFNGTNVVSALLGLEAACRLEEGEPERAIPVADQALALARKGSVPELIATGLGFRGLGLARLGDEAAARSDWTEGAVMMDKVDSLTDRVWFECSVVDGCIALGDLSAAAQRLTALDARIDHLPTGSSLKRRTERSAAAVKEAVQRAKGRSSHG